VVGERRVSATNQPSLLDSDDSTLAVIGRLSVAPGENHGAIGSLRDLGRVLTDKDVDVVLITDRLADDEFLYVSETAAVAGCGLLALPERFHLAGVWPRVVWVKGQPLVQLSAPSLRASQLALKRVFDLTASLAALTLFAPVMLLIAIAIRLDSPGPVFFRQERLGVGGRRFFLWKFRTMFDGAPDTVHRELVTRMLRGDDQTTCHVGEDGRRVYKLTRDSRITRLGKWLRRASLDELPQFLNVVRGNMSLVGPRPPLPYEVDEYEGWELERLRVKPGITGLWQVSGRNQFSYRQMCELDLEYIRQWSLWMDLTILLRTIPVVITNAGRAA
jgi:exopolysaccharide biosynthesis polyprenyl glycosylphosphotransferase